MSGGLRAVFLVFLLIWMLPGIYGVSGLPTGFCLPDDGSFVIGSYAGSGAGSDIERLSPDSLTNFSFSIGKKVAIGVFFDEWSKDRKFPLNNAEFLSRNGTVPYIRLMMRSSDTLYQKEPQFTLKNIANGKFDLELKKWARDARTFGAPIFIEFGTEVNHWKYPWNGYWNREEKGQADFREAYRHIRDVMTQEGATNLIWVYNVNAESQPDVTWNNLTAYYPGDDLCDVVTVSVFGSQKPYESGKGSFMRTLNLVLSNLSAVSINKPVLVIFGTDVNNKNLDAETWIKEAFSYLSEETKSPVKGLIWWNTAWKNDNNHLHDSSMKLEDNQYALSVFKKGVSDLNIKESFAC